MVIIRIMEIKVQTDYDIKYRMGKKENQEQRYIRQM
jgi:hypothetical protein